MTFDSRWKNPQGKDPEQLWRWAQELIAELRKGDFFDAAFEDNVGDGITNAQLADMAAWTFKARNNSASGDPQDVAADSFTEDTTPVTGDFLLGFLSSDEIRKFNVGNVRGKTLIASGVISSAASLTVALDGDTWDEVEIILIDIVPATDNVSLQLQFDQGSGVLTGASDYQYGFVRGATAVTDSAHTAIVLSAALGSSTNERFTAKLSIYRPGDADLIKVAHWQGGARLQDAIAYAIHGWGELILNDNAITDAVFSMSSGNISTGYYYAIGHKYAA
jgi:hypothetical protein